MKKNIKGQKLKNSQRIGKNNEWRISNAFSWNRELGKSELKSEVLTNVKHKPRFNALKVKQIGNP